MIRGWPLFFCGICMGAADLIPGISGGTIAFILGFYQPLLESLKTLNWSNGRHLLRGDWQIFKQQVAWRFLVTLLAGIGCAFFCLAGFFHWMLSHEVYRVHLYAAFLGLILASSVFCLRQVHQWSWATLTSLCLGMITAYLLTGFTLSSIPEGGYHQLVISSDFFFNRWLFICGALAACALLLPGISGSYLLTVLGVYPLILQALVDFIQALKRLSFNGEAFVILWSLALGIITGAVVFSRFLSWLLKAYPNHSVALLSGFMIGALRSVWPFGSYPSLPPWNSSLVWQAILCAVIGFVLVVALENIRRRFHFV